MREAAEAKHLEVRPRVAFAVVRVEALRGAALQLDDEPFPPEALNVRTPVDPGSHRIRALRDGEVVGEASFEATSGEASVVTMEIPARGETMDPNPQADVAVPPVIAPEAMAPPPASPPSLTDTATRPSHRGRRVALVLTALAVVGGGVALGIALSGGDAPQVIEGTAGTREIR